jgi:hypothetical protein
VRFAAQIITHEDEQEFPFPLLRARVGLKL